MPSVIGDIRLKWEALGGSTSFLGQPLTDELTTPDGVGRFNHFQGGSIYWKPGIGAHEVHGDILDKWASLGFERSLLGYPLTDEMAAPDGTGRFNRFQGGSIYWSPRSKAHELHGAIRDKWSSMGSERSFLGYPMTDETPTPDGIGRFNHFQGGSIYWTPATGAHEVHGAILDKWAAMGFERSFLGYPTSDEAGAPGGARVSTFEHGTLTWTLAGGAVPSIDIVHHRAAINTQDWAPLGGSIDLVINRHGDFTFAGHMHDSGFPNIHFVLAAVAMTPSGVGYGFAREHSVDGTITILGRNRDDDWTDTGRNAPIGENWDQVSQSTLHWRLVAGDTLSRGVEGLIEDIVKQEATALGKQGLAALVALI